MIHVDISMSRVAVLLTIVLLARSACAAPPLAPDKKNAETAKGSFLHLTRDKANRPLALETAIVHCTPSPGKDRTATVDLVAAIHIADPAYYQQLNREFEAYDAVLYELVASEESISKAPRPNGSNGRHPITLLQKGMKDVLNLEFQLQGIDYTRKNMVHADMSPEQFARSMQERGESAATIAARMVGYALARQSDGGFSNGQMLMALMDKNRDSALKRVLAEQLAAGEGSMAAWERAAGSTLIRGRNHVALDVLRKEIASGKSKIAIFYGAAHMPDFLERLRDEFGLTPADTRWLTAWNLQP